MLMMMMLMMLIVGKVATRSIIAGGSSLLPVVVIVVAVAFFRITITDHTFRIAEAPTLDHGSGFCRIYLSGFCHLTFTVVINNQTE
jgi:hypothetical protein